MKVTELIANYLIDSVKEIAHESIKDKTLQVEVNFKKGSAAVCDFEISTKGGINALTVKIWSKEGIFLENITNEINKIIQWKI